MVRHRQLASEWSALNEGLSAGTKVQTVVRLVQDIAEPVVVFTAFKATARRLAEQVAAVGVTPVLFTGDETPEDRRRARDQFVAGQADVIIGTFGTMCEGVDGLQQVARHVVLLDRDWTPARNQQAVARVQRDGQTRPVVVHEIVAADTVDDILTDILDAKTTLLAQILSGE
jgi:SNF2 family DNA or RNA helicase